MPPATCEALRACLLAQLARQTGPGAAGAACFILKAVAPTADPQDVLPAAMPLLDHLLEQAAQRALTSEQLLLAADLLLLITPAALSTGGKQRKGADAGGSLLTAAQASHLSRPRDHAGLVGWLMWMLYES